LKTVARKLEAQHPYIEAMDFTQLAEMFNEHFTKEERLLFPLLGRCLGTKICDGLKKDHVDIIKIARKLDGRFHPVEAYVSQLERLFLTHISKEENVLFWYLDVQQSTLIEHVA
jgi:iron-sulfur cluster repair protein YtfE (RIC family)